MTRLRQVALAASALGPAVAEVEAALGADDVLAPPFSDPGVGEFGLENAVFAVGDTFLEVVAPLRGEVDTAAGRYLAKRGVDAGGYMALFQVADMDAARARLAGLGVRVVWQADRPDISGTHLHPKDVPGAIVSLDTPRPAESWRWGGPAWIGGAPAFVAGTGIVGITVSCSSSPAAVAARWGDVLGEDVAALGLDFVAGAEPGCEAIVGVTLAHPDRAGEVEVCGVRFSFVSPS